MKEYDRAILKPKEFKRRSPKLKKLTDWVLWQNLLQCTRHPDQYKNPVEVRDRFVHEFNKRGIDVIYRPNAPYQGQIWGLQKNDKNYRPERKW